MTVPDPPNRLIPQYAGRDGFHFQPRAGLIGNEANLRGKHDSSQCRHTAIK